jgi:trimeric autotransporter adhesin
MKIRFIILALLFLNGSRHIIGQTSSSSLDIDNVGLGCQNCTALGVNALIGSSLGTADNTATGYNSLRFCVWGYHNVANGAYSLYNNSPGNAFPGIDNTAIGDHALWSNLSGDGSTAVGASALENNFNGYNNTASGLEALKSNHNAYGNTATGTRALAGNDASGSVLAIGNTAIGNAALTSNVDGKENTAIGKDALYFNFDANYNTAIGNRALYKNNGSKNTAAGVEALYNNTSGINNTGIGVQALYNNTQGSSNTAFGASALLNNTNGSNLVAVGPFALSSINLFGIPSVAVGTHALANSLYQFNTAVGSFAMAANVNGVDNVALGNSAFELTVGSYCTGIGAFTDMSSVNDLYSTAIGYLALVNSTNKVRLGNTSVQKVRTNVAWTAPSDKRFKTNISEEDVKGLNFIKKLRPVVYNFDLQKFNAFIYKNKSGEAHQKYMQGDFSRQTAVRRTGFIAQEVEIAAREVGYDFDGVNAPKNEDDNYSVCYSKFVVPLTKAVKEQQIMIENLAIEINQKAEKLKTIEEMLKGVQKNTNSVTDHIDYKISIKQDRPETFQISFEKNPPDNSKLTIYDLSGKQIIFFTLEARNKTLTISEDELSKGIYVCYLMDGKQVLGKSNVVIK